LSQTLDQLIFSLFSNPIPVQAFIVGMIGSLAYYTALRLGYVGGEQSTALLRLFTRFLVAWFCIIGGSIAAVFQLAQLTSFAPVQAFVLGVTWPTLVSQYVTGAAEVEKKHFVDQVRGFTTQ
jgi:hypothetical protein